MAATLWVTQTARDVPASLAGRVASLASRSQGQIVDDLRLLGRGVHLPGPDGRIRLFVPASPHTDKRLPPVTGVGIVAEGATTVGMAFIPPGEALLEAWVERVGQPPQGRGVEEAADHITRAFKALGLAKSVKISRAPGRLRVDYLPTWTAEACQAGRDDATDARMGCPTCSLAATLAAYALAMPIRYVSTRAGEAGAIMLDLEAVEWHEPAAEEVAAPTRVPLQTDEVPPA